MKLWLSMSGSYVNENDKALYRKMLLSDEFWCFKGMLKIDSWKT